MKILTLFLFCLLCLVSLSVVAFNKDNMFLSECNEFSMANSLDVFKSLKSGVYIHPFLEKKCFLLSFDKDKYLKRDIIYPSAKNSLFYKFFNSRFVGALKLKVSDKYSYDLVKYDMKSSQYSYFKYQMDNFDIYFTYGDEIIFIHEIFHIAQKGIKSSSYADKEIYSDLASLIYVLRNTSMSESEFIELLNVVRYLRYEKYLTISKASIAKKNDKFKYIEEKAKHDFNKFYMRIMEINTFLEIKDYIDEEILNE